MQHHGAALNEEEYAEPQVLIALLGPFCETAERILDEAVKRSKTGAIHILRRRRSLMLAIGE
eukprot:4690916-Pyramimonas_sp.AAC.1